MNTNKSHLVFGKQTWEIAKEKKDDIEVMKLCCEAELKSMKSSGLVPAPYYFERVAILSRKNKNYTQEIFYCEQYINHVKSYYFDKNENNLADVRKGSRYKAIAKRVAKAKELLAKQQ